MRHPILYVRDWITKYENNRSKALKRLDWVPIPNRMDGKGYFELLDHPNGASHFGAWIAIVEIASRCQTRGTLSEDGQGFSPTDLFRMSRIPSVIFEEVLPRLLEIGWLEKEVQLNQQPDKIQQGGAGIQHLSADNRPLKGREGKGTEANGSVVPAAPNPIKALRDVYHSGNRPTTERDWSNAATAIVNCDISDDEIFKEVVPWVQEELSKTGTPRKFYAPETLFTLDIKPWKGSQPSNGRPPRSLIL